MSAALAWDERACDPTALRPMAVRQVRWEAEGVISLQLVTADGSSVPSWRPGAHVDLVLPSGLVRQYSLCGDPNDRRSLTVAVQREPDGRGGSRELHDTPLLGRVLGVRGPRNHFELRTAGEYLLIAGGIGITPIIAMVRSLDVEGAPWRLVYGGRSRSSMAFLGELSAYGAAVQVVPQDELGLPDLDAALDACSPGARVWCCGPEGLLRDVEVRGAARGIPVHVERFAPAAPSAPGTVPGKPPAAADVPTGFEVELRRSGRTVHVGPDRSVLRAVRDYLPGVISSCEEGFCGACETRVLAGMPEHRDQVLDDTERAANRSMMICVSRSHSAKLVLDL